MQTTTSITCPSCKNPLSSVITEAVTVDICNSGCGGIWFDRTELDRFEDPAIFLPPKLFRVLPNSLVAIDRSKSRKCPKCPDQVLHEQLRNDTLGIEVDSCLKCAGVWLDLGEINSIRNDKKKIAEMESEISRIQQLAAGLTTIPKGLLAVLRLIFT